uniref:Putative secreted protein n=1 Tax=Anopheles marajoara TaxID=58244 RepID=A0A2M4CBS7_9DIPT
MFCFLLFVPCRHLKATMLAKVTVKLNASGDNNVTVAIVTQFTACLSVYRFCCFCSTPFSDNLNSLDALSLSLSPLCTNY